MDIPALRRSILDARDERAAAVTRLVEELASFHGRAASPGWPGDRVASGERARPATGSSLVIVSLNIPGPDKNPPGATALFGRAMAALRSALPGARLALERCDALGPWAALVASQPAPALKHACVELEESSSAGRLLDLDVFGADGRQVDRAAMGWPPRRCLACDQPAADCIRLGRHLPADLDAAVQALLS